MSRVIVAGVGTTRFGAFPNLSLKSLCIDAINCALEDAGIGASDIGKVFFGNASAGVITQQEMIRGQVVLRHHALRAKPLINIENACASGGSALHLAYLAVSSGEVEVALALGAEKMHHPDKSRAFKALWGSTDIEEIGEFPEGELAKNSVLMEYYAGVAHDYLKRYDATAADYARVAVKNRHNAQFNPIAQFRKPQTVEQVLQSRMIADPLTLSMCAPLTDGAAAIVVCSEAYARRLNKPMLTVRACSLASSPGPELSPVVGACQAAYEESGFGPHDLDFIELHDAAAPAELLQYSELGLCEEGQAHHLIRSGYTDLDGTMPVNPSGGLLSRGHALGATGCVQVAELYFQLLGRAEHRQISNARVGMAVNGGGWLDNTYAVTVTTILERLA